MKYIRTGLAIVLCLLIFGCLFFFLGSILFKFWGPVISTIPKFSSPFFDALLRCFAVLLLTISLCFLVGILFSTKIRKNIPILKGMGDLNQRPFVFVKDYPDKGFWTIGIITGKQKIIIDRQTKKQEIRPRVYIPYPSNPTSGFLVFPDKEKLILIKPSTSSMIQMIISMGMLGPETIYSEIDGPDLNFYYS